MSSLGCVKLPASEVEAVPESTNILEKIDGATITSVIKFFQNQKEKYEREGFHRLRLDVDYEYDIGELVDIKLRLVGVKRGKGK